MERNRAYRLVLFKNTNRENTLSNKTQALMKSMNMDI